MSISQTEDYFERTYPEKPMLFLLAKNAASKKKTFWMLKEKPTQILL